MNDQAMIVCKKDGAKCHSVQLHLKANHPGYTIADYQRDYPGEPLLSEFAKAKIAEKQAAAGTAPAAAAASTPATPAAEGKAGVVRKPLHEVFDLEPGKETRAANGSEIMTEVLTPALPEMVPQIDPNYVYNADVLKNVLMAVTLNIPLYVWGHAGTGKTTVLEQACARTGRELIRVQHTVNTEESHIVGQWVAKDGSTEFSLGPLAEAMKYGWVYLADEYDFALPSVLSVYQPVLEGKALVIKEADAANRVIKPHPNFRFIATGNTNGSGDETGLYQGTNIQNAANYDRFHMVIEVKYMDADKEVTVLEKQAGIKTADAKRMVEFATKVRENYATNKCSSPISPRTLIAAAKIGKMKGSFRAGLSLAYSNKLNRVDFGVIDGIAQRIFS